MPTRRELLGAISMLSAAEVLGAKLPSRAPAPPSTPSQDLTQYVNVMVGTGGHGHTYPGATVPFGMVQLSPDTFNDGWDWCSGYHVNDTSMMGFSHTHLSGTGIGDMLDILLMPGTGSAKILPGSRENPNEGYRSRFSHQDEQAEPGYYSVLLKDYGIRAELTATERTGVHRYTFPQSDASHFIIDLAHVYGNKPELVLASELTVAGNDTIVGSRSTAAWAKGREIYFAMQFSRPFANAEIFSAGEKLAAGTRQAKSRSLQCVVHFKTNNNEAILVRVGLSGVSVEGARKNLQAEAPGWDFEAIRESARRKWQRELSKVRIETTDRKQKEIFYSALYHTMLAPTLFDDVDGQYRGMDGRNHQLPSETHNYSTFSLWDTYRATHPLYTLMQADRVPDFVNCLVRMTNESPLSTPVWPLQAKETSCMSGYHSVVVMAEAAVKGFKGLDLARAYPAIRKRAMVDDYEGLADYRKYGYIPCDLGKESASRTLDYAYDDWAVSQIAQALGHANDCETLKKRSRSYANLFDRKRKFIRPKLQNGEWAEPFDPKEISIVKRWFDFTESNAWQATFANQHDVRHYMEMFGGRAAFVAQLDALFTQSSDLPADTPPDVAGLVGMYAHGNEPSHHIAYLYCYGGAPWKTQERVRMLLETMYRAEPDGMAGNEDCGQMSAWFVMSALGFYAVDPVSGNYVFGTPLFDQASIDLGGGHTLHIEAKRESAKHCYIQSIDFNGKPYRKTWFRHADLRNGAKIVFHMGPEPNRLFGADENAAPPSMA